MEICVGCFSSIWVVILSNELLRKKWKDIVIIIDVRILRWGLGLYIWLSRKYGYDINIKGKLSVGV